MTYQNITPNQLGQAAITASTTTLYTVPTSTRTFLKDMDICNTTSGAITVNIYIVPSAGTASTSNALLYGALVPANSTLQWTGSQILLTGSTIQISASATGCTIVASGGEAI